MKLLLVFVALTAAACTAEQTDSPRAETNVGSPAAERTMGSPAAHSPALSTNSTYDFQQPVVSIELHDDLKEISALTLLSDGRIGAVQDEDGIVFVLNRETGAIEDRWSFGDRGDYEGIERVGDRVYVLRADGTLIELSSHSGNAQTRILETDLTRKNDTEGLAHDPAGNRLLIVCKEEPGGGVDKNLKAVYAFDLEREALIPDPVLVIEADEIDRQSDRKGSFKPSAMAVHPASGSLYVLSSTTRVIAVLNPEGELQEIHRLPGGLFEQPEGLTFLSDGTLYIASEGGGDSGVLYAFAP